MMAIALVGFFFTSGGVRVSRQSIYIFRDDIKRDARANSKKEN